MKTQATPEAMPRARKVYGYVRFSNAEKTPPRPSPRKSSFLSVISRVDADGRARVIGSVGLKDELAKQMKNEGWNEVHVIARGNVLTHLVNGRVMSVVIDDDAARRKFDGLLGVQVHVGPPMKVEFRNIRLKRLVPEVVPTTARLGNPAL
jgi:hypothetical protein